MRSDELIVDARGLACPHPVLQARAQLRVLAPGTRIVLLATDPLASVDVRAFCLRAGHGFIDEERCGDHLRFTLERGG
ncbi:MAG: sulfurtransferase TusA family protein [Xanthomonadales bacterium]|nr:sulfurtransferase TusA family protein [Xanthomonadales bacterium]MBK7145989.1 sulfurtransferase TusA family protein [Xanthomonadales bacterium]MCC6561927.1 sulfurtransferase TusA family protein [Xanthomonadales bacterium]